MSREIKVSIPTLTDSARNGRGGANEPDNLRGDEEGEVLLPVTIAPVLSFAGHGSQNPSGAITSATLVADRYGGAFDTPQDPLWRGILDPAAAAFAYVADFAHNSNHLTSLLWTLTNTSSGSTTTFEGVQTGRGAVNLDYTGSLRTYANGHGIWFYLSVPDSNPSFSVDYTLDATLTYEASATGQADVTYNLGPLTLTLTG